MQSGLDGLTTQFKYAESAEFSVPEKSVVQMLCMSRLSIAVAVSLIASFLLVPAGTVRALDTEPPWVASHYPGNGMNNVPLSAQIYVNFSEQMNQLTVTVDIFPFVALAPSWDMMGQSVVLDHMVLFVPNTWYTVTVDGSDLAGNPLDGNQDGMGGDPLIWTFMATCGHCILSTDPYDGEQNVNLDRPIVVIFSDRVDSMMLTFNTVPAMTFTPIWNIGNTLLTLTHAVPFQACITYRVTIGGASLDPGPVANPWQFTTTGCQPVITGMSPPQADAALDAPIRVDISTTMNNATVTWSLNRTMALSSSWNVGNTTLNLTHAVKFTPCTAYGFSITGRDMFGQLLDNGAFPMPYNFTTVCTYPRVTQKSPTDGQVNVQLDASIIVTFSESMDNQSVEDSFTYSDGTTIYSKVNGTSTWNADDTVFTFSPGSPYRTQWIYTAKLNPDIAHGLGDNHLDGNENGVPEGSPADDVVWQFTTVQVSDTTPPAVQTVSPAPGASGVPRTTSVVVTFSEAMNKLSVQQAIQVSDGRVAYNFNWPDNRTVSFSLIPGLFFGTPYTITIANSASDLVGNHMVSDYEWTFTTEKWRGDIHGRVVDDADGSPISNATVTLNGIQTLTDADGNFTFTNVEQGTYVLTVEKDGYDSSSGFKDVAEGIQDMGTIRLRKTQAVSSDVTLVVVGIVIAVVIVLILLVLLSRRRRKVQPATFEQWKGEVAEVERPDSGQ